MATNKPISGFPLITGTDLEPADLLAIVDVSNTSSSPTGTTSSVALSSVLNNPQNGIITGKLTPIRAVATSGQIVNTAQNGIVIQSTGGTLTDFLFLDSTGNQIAAGRAVDSAFIATKFMCVSAAPSVAVAAGAGAGATATIVGTDGCGVVTLATGTGVSPAAVMFTITFSNPYAGAAAGNVTYSFPDGSVNNYPPVGSATTGTTLQLAVLGTAALSDSTNYKFNYMVMGYGN